MAEDIQVLLNRQQEKESYRLRNIPPEVIEVQKAYIIRQATGLKGAGNVSLMPGYDNPQGRTAYTILTQNPEIKSIVNQGVGALSEASRLGFSNVIEYQQAQGFAGKPAYTPHLQAKSTYVDPSGKGYSVTPESLKAGLEEGTFKPGGTYRDPTAQFYTYTTTQTEVERLPTFVEKAITKYEDTRQSKIPSKVKQVLIEATTETEDQRRLREYEAGTSYKDLFAAGQLPSIVRKASTGAGTLYFRGTEAVRTKVFGGEKLTSTQMELGGQVLGSAFLFAGVSPFTTSTFAIEKSLQQTGVVFTGSKQLTQKGLVKTDLGFRTSKGEQGIVRGISKIKAGDVTISKTDAYGIVFKRGVQFPSAKEVVTIQKAFGSRAVGLSKQLPSGVIQQVSGGKIILKTGTYFPRTSRDIFLGRSFSYKGDTLSVIAGQTFTKKTAGSISAGLIKTLSKSGGVTTISKSFGGGASQSIQQSIAKTIAKGDIQSITKAAISTPSIVKTPTILMGTAGGLSILKTPSVKAKTIQSISPKLKEKLSPTQPIAITQVTGQGITPRSAARQVALPRARQTSAQAVNISQITTQGQIQKVVPSLRIKTLQEQKFGYEIIPIIPFTPTTTTRRITSFPFKLRTTLPTQTGGLFGVSVSKTGRRFKTIGAGLSLGRAITVGTLKVKATSLTAFRITPQQKQIITEGLRTPRGFKRKPGLIFIKTK